MCSGGQLGGGAGVRRGMVAVASGGWGWRDQAVTGRPRRKAGRQAGRASDSDGQAGPASVPHPSPMPGTCLLTCVFCLRSIPPYHLPLPPAFPTPSLPPLIASFARCRMDLDPRTRDGQDRTGEQEPSSLSWIGTLPCHLSILSPLLLSSHLSPSCMLVSCLSCLCLPSCLCHVPMPACSSTCLLLF